MKGDSTWGGEHTTQRTEEVLHNCTPETCILSLTNVTPTNSIKKRKKNFKCLFKKFNDIYF